LSLREVKEIEEVFDVDITSSIVDELAKIALPLRGA